MKTSKTAEVEMEALRRRSLVVTVTLDVKEMRSIILESGSAQEPCAHPYLHADSFKRGLYVRVTLVKQH